VSSEPTTSTLALAVWPTPSRRRHHYLAASSGKHPIQPELAARAILAYSDAGDLVVDPCCGIGTVLVEAIQQGRRALGIEAERQVAALAIANISHARQQGAPGRGAVLEGNPERLPQLLAKAQPLLTPKPTARLRRHPAGSVQLLLTATRRELDGRLLRAWTGVLTPGGFLLLVREQQRRASAGLSTVVASAEQAGLEYWQHVIAFRSSPADPAALLHTDVLAFRKPQLEERAARRRADWREVAA
jgi:SAM-dependent methyltransferase